jgi:hypothetical protein
MTVGIGLVDLGVEVPAEVLGDGLHQWSVGLGPAGAEGDEAPVIGSQQGPGPADGQLSVAATQPSGVLVTTTSMAYDRTGAFRVEQTTGGVGATPLPVRSSRPEGAATRRCW